MTNEKTRASEEQIVYANVLNVGMVIGLIVLTVTFLIYMSGLLPSYVPIEDLPKYWTMRAHEFNTTLNIPTGWGWIAHAGKGDYLNFVGIAMLSGLTILCYLFILPILKRKKDLAYLTIAIVEVLVLVLAASGILKSGH